MVDIRLYQVFWRFDDERPQSKHMQLYKNQTNDKMSSLHRGDRINLWFLFALWNDDFVPLRSKGLFRNSDYMLHKSCHKILITLHTNTQNHTVILIFVRSKTQWKKQTSLWILASVTKPAPLSSKMEKPKIWAL